jgi:hypothetical protein
MPTTTLTLAQQQYSPGTNSLGPFTPQAGQGNVRLALNLPTTDYETLGNGVTLRVVRVADGVILCEEDWASTGAPLIFQGSSDPPPALSSDMTPYLGQSLQADFVTTRTLTFGATVTIS